MQQPPLNLAFFWHMHQPDYRDSEGVMKMPWVFLHALKDYYEMPWLLERHPGLKATFNITPPLIEQLALYREPLTYDYFLSLWAKHPSELDAGERGWVIKMCRSAQFDTMVKPLPRFAELYRKETLDDAELIEAEVLFILSWCGNALRGGNETVKTMLARGKGYVQQDKAPLLDALCAFVAGILPYYAALQEAGRISLSTTPYNHPILPLLIDMENARRANPDAVLPDNPLSLEDDAVEQVRRAITLYENTFGTAPRGFWPAEGAVDEASVAIYREHGLRWIATDEAILFRSLGSEERSALYRPYRFDEVTIGFRDHGISDLIGFTYRFKAPQEAADHFMRTIEPLRRGEEEATLFVILDGENAWEFFENNAYDFFMELYRRIGSAPWCRTVTMDEISEMPSPALPKLSPGSWIHGDFGTWSGHPEKNRAWELIYQTRRDTDHFPGTLSDEAREAIRTHFLAAECSDWFWWYGDDHATDFAAEFDTLFREHLIAVYRLMGIPPPSDLYIPIISRQSGMDFLRPPQSPISPVIDGRESSFFEWLGSGCVDESGAYSTMDRVRGPIERIRYGHDDRWAYLAFEGALERIDLSATRLLVIVEETDERIDLALGANRSDRRTKLAVGERIEVALAREYFAGHSRVHLRFELILEETILQALPGFGALTIDFKQTYAENWFV